MPDHKVLGALGLAPEASEREIAVRMRQLAGLAPDAATDAALWTRFVEAIDIARHGRGGARGDRAVLANRIVEWAIVPPGAPDEERWGSDAWDRELGLGYAESDDFLRMLVIDRIAPLLVDAGLFQLL